MEKPKRFQVSLKVIWGSSIALAVMASIPKLFDADSTPGDLIINSSITLLFSLFIWYYNIYSLPKFSSNKTAKSLFNWKLLLSVVLGILLMVILVIAHQELFQVSKMDAPIMFELRGVLINLIVYMFLHLLFQNYQTQQMGVELERTKAVNLGAQYELLKQQINPHFLFNSLNTLKSMVDMNDENSSDFILKLSDFYRFTLESRKLDLIPLREEIQILDSYVYLLKARFEDGFVLENEIDEKQYESVIPPFALQLLIENCIKHNVVSLNKPLKIRLYSEKDFLVIENPIQLKRGAIVSTGVGLDNINQRFMHLVHKEIEIDKNETTFKVKIPLIYDHRNN
ncbi:LytS/YehU family sensor histidine kinase [Flavobacterium nitrogenifigens]|uniref:LytS/YehU family sensor histidine kinase n=2 Tax=Flavobacterium TaxID=237 RepID=A0A7W7IYA2_9FLAO|nr:MULTISPECIES: histidine kinase [Flavobacterium]MBB4802690.1 LytS/YehU family sensor histidine kinase [Flavobacterium nitrogenifigens]MBB6387648.1 LytS/YehU family sensor histidine kinase [Flavobacterium notoginsengisoli]